MWRHSSVVRAVSNAACSRCVQVASKPSGASECPRIHLPGKHGGTQESMPALGVCTVLEPDSRCLSRHVWRFLSAGCILMLRICVVGNVTWACMPSGLDLVASPRFNEYQVSRFRGTSRCTDGSCYVCSRIPTVLNTWHAPCIHSTHLHQVLHC